MLKLIGKMMGGKVEEEAKAHDSRRVLGEALRGRAWEVLEAAERQFPEATRQVKEALAQLASEGKLKGAYYRRTAVTFT